MNMEALVAAVAVERFRAAKARDGAGWVYAIAAEEVSRVKFGFSISPDKRLLELATASPVPLKIVARRRGTYQDEGAIHRRLERYRSHGEWFRLEGEVLAVIDEILSSPHQLTEGEK